MLSRSSLHCSFSLCTSHISCCYDQDSCNESNYCVKDVVVNVDGASLLQHCGYSKYEGHADKHSSWKSSHLITSFWADIDFLCDAMVVG